jgi:uncharacterized membrane protein HdeD (DUF308 family)
MPAAAWITLARAILAFGLGAALLLYPDKTRPMLVNFMGMFWLVSGLMSVRWGTAGQRARGLPLLAGTLGILAGIVTLSRLALRGLINEIIVVYFLALVILLTGVLHMVGGFRTGELRARQRSRTSFLLGVLEVILGIALFILPLERGTLLHLLLTAWALLGGLILLLDAFHLRRAAQRTAQPTMGNPPLI